MVILHTTLTKQLKLEDMYITPHYSESQTHHMNNRGFTIEDYPGQIAHFTALFHTHTTLMPYTTII